VPRVPSLQELLGLWRGDEDSYGYAQEGLAREICRKLRPETEVDLFRQLYPGLEPGEADVDVRKMVALAFRKWSVEKK
jgi:hypothetical protein